MIETKQLNAAETLLAKARKVYELAGVVVTAQENESRCYLSVRKDFRSFADRFHRRWELRDLHKKPYASPQEMALSGVIFLLFIICC